MTMMTVLVNIAGTLVAVGSSGVGADVGCLGGRGDTKIVDHQAWWMREETVTLAGAGGLSSSSSMLLRRSTITGIRNPIRWTSFDGLEKSREEDSAESEGQRQAAPAGHSGGAEQANKNEDGNDDQKPEGHPSDDYLSVTAPPGPDGVLRCEDEDNVTQPDQQDEHTPDAWICRHPKLIRLTGKHPLNAEAPLDLTLSRGFLTPTSLHYVRNHGAVPKLDQNLAFVIKGMVKIEKTLTVKELRQQYPPRELAITLVCDGNRRKELNTIKKTHGFSYGAGAVSSSVWKGSYGTSIPLGKALDPAEDVLLAYEMNGEPLHPDHGYPLRVVIPGYVGGRQVKWLSEIRVESRESNSWYHFHDNKVLPPDVDDTIAKQQNMWLNQHYMLTQLNINSAIAYPMHGEVWSHKKADETYAIKGYAYTGGGRPIQRVEVSLDQGNTWRTCRFIAQAEPTEYGRNWCWVHWQLEVTVEEVFASKDLIVRAVDEAFNMQPERPTWNLLGMMNNCWYRVRVNTVKGPDQELALSFQHPTVPGTGKGGWMEKPEEDQPEIAGGKHGAKIKMAEVRKHTSEKDAWLVLAGKVFNVTDFLKDHPGGAEPILMNAGQDATDEFDSIHDAMARQMTAKYYIEVEEVPKQDDRGRPIALNPRKAQPFMLEKKTQVSHDTVRLRFALPSKEHVMGLPVGKHITVSARIDGKLIVRPYTPVSNDDEDQGFIQLVVKVYPQGRMSQRLHSLKEGDTIDFKGPVGRYVYKGNGEFDLGSRTLHVKHVGMVAGGTGITPMYQVMSKIVRDKDDAPDVKLVFANKTEDDILLHNELDQMALDNRDKVGVYHVISHPKADDWSQGRGHINADIIRDHLPPPGEDTLVLMCGPPGLIEKAVKPALQKLGYLSNNVVSY
eukprot:jgi/Chlat1/6102/Chrsp40S05686